MDTVDAGTAAHVQAAEAQLPTQDGNDDANDNDTAVLAGTIKWGPFRIASKKVSAVQGRPHGGLEALCPYHKKTRYTACKKYMQLQNDSAQHQADVIRCLKGWCLAANAYSYQRHYLMHFVHDPGAPPADAALEAQLLTLTPVGEVLTDVELDSRHPAGQPARVTSASSSAGAVSSGGAALRNFRSGCQDMTATFAL